jgi:hypothetical protein
MHRTKASVREAARARWLWLAPLVALLGLALLVITPGLLVHWQGNGSGDQSPRPLTRVELIAGPDAPAETLATVAPAAGRSIR